MPMVMTPQQMTQEEWYEANPEERKAIEAADSIRVRVVVVHVVCGTPAAIKASWAALAGAAS